VNAACSNGRLKVQPSGSPQPSHPHERLNLSRLGATESHATRQWKLFFVASRAEGGARRIHFSSIDPHQMEIQGKSLRAY
jgi:hypothetical protein